MSDLQRIIEDGFEDREKITPETTGKLRSAVDETLNMLDSGELRVAEPDGRGEWKVNQWAKKAVLLSFRLNDNQLMPCILDLHGGAATWWDKVQSKFAFWNANLFREAGFRAVPGSLARHSAYIGKNVVLMPSFVNLGAYIDEGTMIDTWATVGSCAQIGKNCHISGGAGIGGVLEPLQANPVIIEDNCFIGARSEVVEGVIVREGAVLSMGVFIGQNTPIVDRTKGNTTIRGEVPARAVIMMGYHPDNHLACPHIVKYRDKKTDAATALNSILRD